MKTFIYSRTTTIYLEQSESESRGWMLLIDGEWVARPSAPDAITDVVSGLEKRGLVVTHWRETYTDYANDVITQQEYVVAHA